MEDLIMTTTSSNLSNIGRRQDGQAFSVEGTNMKTFIRTNDITQSTVLQQVTAETLNFTAGAAGVTGTVLIAKAPIYDSLGAFIGSKADSSFAFVTGTILTTEIECNPKLTDAEILAALTVGQYCINYTVGKLYYCKATTGTSDTANYKIRKTDTNITINTGDVEIGSVELKNATTDDRAAIVTAASAKTGATMVLVTQNIDSNGNIGGGSSPSLVADYKSPADFTVAYGTTSTLTLSGLPTGLTIASGSQISYVKILDSTSHLAKIIVNGSASYSFGYSAGTLTVYLAGVASAEFAATNTYEVGVNGNLGARVATSTMGVTDPAMAVYDKANPITSLSEYTSPTDGSAAYTSNVTITCTGFPFTVDDSVCYIRAINYKPTGGSWVRLVNGHDSVSMVASSGVITVTGAGTPFAAGDTYKVNIEYQKKGYDLTNDSIKSIEQTPLWARYTDKETLIAAAQTLTTSFADAGYEIDCRGYTSIGIWVKLTANQATNMQMQALVKHTSAGTEEYNIPIESVSSGLVNVTSEIIQFPDANGLYLMKIKTDNLVAFLQLQFKETDNGTDATLDTLYATKGY